MTATTLAPTLTGVGGLVVSYERISRFRATNVDATITRGVTRQAEDSEDLAAARDLGPVLHLDGDEGISASRFETRDRKDWPRLLGMVRAGQVSVVLVWNLDRIIRQTRDLDDLLDACRATGAVIIQTLTGTTVNPDDPESVAMAKIQAVLAETEVAKMSKRQTRKQAALAKDGRPHGGQRTFGYANAAYAPTDPEDPSSVFQADEAAAVRAVAARVLQGESLASCAKWLAAEGYTGTSGGKWTGPNLGKFLQRPSLAALRVHKGEVVGEATWPALIDAATHARLVDFLTAEDRRVVPAGTSVRTHLLSGLATCGRCGAAVTIAGGTNRRHLGLAYRCNVCYGVQRPLAEVDQLVNGWMVERLARTDARGGLADDTASVELANLTASAKALAGRRAAQVTHQAIHGALSEDDYAATLAAMDAEANRLAKAIRGREDALSAPERDLDGLTGPNPREVWEDLSMARKRRLIRILCTVRIERAAHRGARFSEESVTITPTRG